MARKKRTEKRKSNAGRKCMYEKKVKQQLSLIEGWREKGCSEKLIADKLNIAYSTLSEYKEKFPEFKEVLSKSKEKLTNNLKKTLWKEALGYEYQEIHEEARVEPVIDENGKVNNVVKEIKKKKITKWYRPQQSLMIFALCNLLPEEFQRIDKDIIDNIGEELEKRIFSSENIKKAFFALYPDQKKIELENKETKKDG